MTYSSTPPAKLSNKRMSETIRMNKLRESYNGEKLPNLLMNSKEYVSNFMAKQHVYSDKENVQKLKELITQLVKLKYDNFPKEKVEKSKDDMFEEIIEGGNTFLNQKLKAYLEKDVTLTKIKDENNVITKVFRTVSNSK